MLANRPPLQAEKRLTEGLAQSDRTVALSLLAGAASLMVLPILLRGFLPAPVKTAMLLGAVGTSGALVAVAGQANTQERQRQYQVFDRVHQEHTKNLMAHEINQQQILADLLARMRLANVAQQLPPHARQQFAAQYGLQSFVQFPEFESVPVAARPVAESTPAPAVRVSQIFDGLIPDPEGPDTSWVDASFWLQSKSILGVKGTGKSLLMKTEAAQFKQLAPNGILWVNDPHFDKAPEPEQEQEQWLRPIPVDVLERDYIRKSSEAMLNRWREFRRVMRQRVSQDDKVGIRASRDLKKQGWTNEPVIKLIQDEFIAAVTRWTDEESAEVISIIQECEYEWRKYGGMVTLGLHSLKTKQNGLDSSLFLSMVFVALGNSLADANTRWSAEFNIQDLLKAQQTLKHQWPDNYNCVVRFPGEAPQAVPMPFLEWPMLNTDGSSQPVLDDVQPDTVRDVPTVDDDDVLAPLLVALNEWIDAMGRVPTDDELVGKFKLLTKRDLGEKGLVLLKEKLGL